MAPKRKMQDKWRNFDKNSKTSKYMNKNSSTKHDQISPLIHFSYAGINLILGQQTWNYLQFLGFQMLQQSKFCILHFYFTCGFCSEKNKQKLCDFKMPGLVIAWVKCMSSLLSLGLLQDTDHDGSKQNSDHNHIWSLIQHTK